jgi:hypothetical protein
MSREVVVVHERFVAAQPVTLELKHTAWFRSDVAATDATTHKRCFKIKEKAWSTSGKHTIMDEQGHEIAAIKEGRSMTRWEWFMKVSGEGFQFEVRCKSSVW